MIQKDKKVLLIRQVRHWKWDMVNRYNLSMTVQPSVSTEGAPVYEQKELRKQRRVP